MKNFAFYVSNKGTRVKKFLKTYKDHSVLRQIKFIFSDNIENQELKLLSNKNNINYYELDLSFVEKQNKNNTISNSLLSYLIKTQVDFLFVFADKILVGDILKVYENKIINFHPSILPLHKGLNAIDQALNENTFLMGNTVHIITKDLDHGSIIMQNIYPSINFKSYEDLLDKQIAMLIQLITWINENRFILDKNLNVLIKDAKYSVEEYIPNLEISIRKIID